MAELSNASTVPQKWSLVDRHVDGAQLAKSGLSAATCFSAHDSIPGKHSVVPPTASFCVTSPSHASVTSPTHASVTSPTHASVTSSSHASMTSLSSPTITLISDTCLATSTDPIDYPDHLLCSICLELLFKPISLNPCGHVFCERCLRRLIETSLSKLLCPLCREVIETCLPAEERAREVLKKFPAHVAERQKSELNIAQSPSLWFQNCRAEPNCQRPTLYIDYSTRWRSALWIFWVGAIGFLMVFSLNSFLNQAIHGGSPHHLPSHPHLSQNNDGPSYIVMLDGGEHEESTPLTSATSTEEHFKYSSDNGKVKADKARNHSVAENVGQRSVGYLFPSLFINFNFSNSFKGYEDVRLRNESSSVGGRLGNYSLISKHKEHRIGR